MGLLVGCLLVAGCVEETGTFPSMEEDAVANAEAIDSVLESVGVRLGELTVGGGDCGDLPASGITKLSIWGDLVGPSGWRDDEIEARVLEAFDAAGWEVTQRDNRSWGHSTFLSSAANENFSVVISVSQAPISAAFGTGCYSESVEDEPALEETLREILG